MTVIGEAAAGKVVDALLGWMIDIFKGTEAQLRRIVPIALATAAEQSGLPDGCDGEWVANAILNDAAAGQTSRIEDIWTSGSQTGDFDESAINGRLQGALRPELITDLARIGIEIQRIVERFGPCLVSAVRSRATGSKSSLDFIASRMEADKLFAAINNVAAAVGANREDQSTMLDDMENESARRIRKRLDVLGVSDLKVLATVVRSLDLVPLPEFEDRGLFGLVAEGGSGKTTLAERIHLASIWLARFDRSAPLPLFIEAISEVSIRDEIRRVWGGQSDLLTRGVDIVVDGLDETGLDRGQAYVGELRSLVNDLLSPVHRAVVTARPLDFGLRDEEMIHVGPLSDDQATAIVAMISAKSTSSVSMTAPLSDAIRRPFFAVASGVVLGEDHGRDFATPSRILKWVAVKAIGNVDGDSFELLARAAAASVDANHGFIPLSKVARSFAEQLTLRSNRIIAVDSTGEKIRFPVALIAEWFAAEHLMNHEEVVAELVADPVRLERWRYPLLLTIEARDASANGKLLKTIAIEAPAMSGWLLTQPDPFHSARLGYTNGVEVDRERAEMTGEFLAAYDAIGKGAAPGSTRLAIFERGRPNPVWLDTAPARVDYSWATNSYGDPNVIDNPPDRQAHEFGRWIKSCSSGMSEHPAWTWRHAHRELSDDLAVVRRSGALFESLPLYERERQWWLALKACAKTGSRNPGALPIEKLQEQIDAWDTVIAQIGQAIPDDAKIVTLRKIVQGLRDQDLEAFEGPWPMPDNIGGSSNNGWVWSIWSDEGMRERLQGATEGALELYLKVVERELPGLKRDLQTFKEIDNSWRFVGYRQSLERADPRLMGVPTAWAIVPGEPGVSWEIVSDVDSAVLELARSFQGVRVRNHEPHGLYQHRPATLFAMSMLEEDLDAWGWGKPGNLASE